MPEGQSRATTDPDVAARLCADRLAELDRARRLRGLHGITKEDILVEYAAAHLRK
ncbi:MAG: hypothetical protein RLN75_07180 [Longimicrobiales bacterium]